MLTEESPKIRQLRGRQIDELEGGQLITLRQLKKTLQVLGPFGMQPGGGQLRGRRAGIGAGKSEAQQALALNEELIQIIGELGGVEDAENLDIAPLEHQAVVGRAPADMAAARRHRETEALPGPLGRFEIPDADQAVVDTGRIRP